MNLASQLERAGVKILGTSPEIIDLAEDRDRFREVMDKLGIPMPEAGMAVTVDEASILLIRLVILSWFVQATCWVVVAWKWCMTMMLCRITWQQQLE